MRRFFSSSTGRSRESRHHGKEHRPAWRRTAGQSPRSRCRAVRPNGLLGGQFDAEVTALPNGNFAVVYTNNAGGQGDLDILGVELTAAGNVVAAAPSASTSMRGNQVGADVAPRVGGGYVAVWEDRGADGNNNNFISLAVIAPGTPSDPDAGSSRSKTRPARPSCQARDRHVRQRHLHRRPTPWTTPASPMTISASRSSRPTAPATSPAEAFRRLSRRRTICTGTTAAGPRSPPSATPPWWSIATSW